MGCERPEEAGDGLERMTMKQLREVAKAEGVCLGYDGARKATAVEAIRGHRRHLEWLKTREVGEQ